MLYEVITVRLSGIKIGSVTSVALDNEEYIADVKMSILPEVRNNFV